MSPMCASPPCTRISARPRISRPCSASLPRPRTTKKRSPGRLRPLPKTSLSPYIIAAAAPSRVVIALRDPDPRTAGGGIERLAAAGIEVKEGVLAEEARDVALGHILRVTEGRPTVTLKLAVGADGLMPKGKGTPVW